MAYSTYSKHRLKSRPHKSRPRKSRLGAAALVELIIVLIVVAVIIAGIISLYGRAMDSVRNMQTGTLISRIVARIEGAYTHQQTYDAGDLVPILFASGQFSKDEVDLVAGSYSATSPYGTAITVVGSGARTFTVTVNDLEGQACNSLIEKLLGDSMSVQSVSVNSTAIALTPAAAASACTGNASDQYDIAMTF